MRKLVFLHGSGSDESAYGELMLTLARFFNADLVCLRAPFKHPQKTDKYTWFNKFEQNHRRDAVVDEYTYSLQYIKEHLNNLTTNPQDIILVGHSQGGGMAVHVGLEVNLACVISINGDLPYNFSYKNTTNTPIYWFESKQDTYINTDRKQSYRLIENNKNFHLLTLDNSTHTDFTDDFLNLLNKGMIRF
ncbi:MAG: alpha/beta fold hydrolase [Alphaproteobacteria bacterium]|nr:alpha/beta fold hydrolase [Alphaproteobacteria bacterium]